MKINKLIKYFYFYEYVISRFINGLKMYNYSKLTYKQFIVERTIEKQPYIIMTTDYLII